MRQSVRRSIRSATSGPAVAPATARPGPSATRVSRPRPRRGVALLAVGLALTVASVVLTALVEFPTGLGTMLGLVVLYAFAAYYVVGGIVRLRWADDDPAGAHAEPAAGAARRPGPAGAPGWVDVEGERTWRCTMVGHRERFVPRTGTAPAHFECPRCGAQRQGHLTTGRGWVCDLPLADHRYDHVGPTEDHPEMWRCRRCGKKRWVPPRSAGETLDATATAGLWVKRGDR